jgi:hypothetical protein
MQVITLGGQTLKNPDEFNIENYKLTRETGRLIDGSMTMDFVALKKKFNFEYKAISGTDLNTILAIINTSTIFFTLTYKDREGTHSVTVYAGAVPQNLYRTDGNWVWTDVKFALIER